jgi:hypothetical protein
VIYEMRSYEVNPGKLPALNARFRDHTLGFFEKHGIKVIGFWEAIIGTSNVLHYIVAFESLAHRENAWSAFQADPGWQRVRAETERDGPINRRVRNEIWQPTDYSPLK